MNDDDNAVHPEHTPMDVINRVLSNLGDNISRLTIVTMDEAGNRFGLYSNARSEAEQEGMLRMGLRVGAMEP